MNRRAFLYGIAAAALVYVQARGQAAVRVVAQMLGQATEIPMQIPMMVGPGDYNPPPHIDRILTPTITMMPTITQTATATRRPTRTPTQPAQPEVSHKIHLPLVNK